MSRMTVADLLLAAEWLDGYEPAPGEDGRAFQRVADWLRSQATKRQEEAIVRAVAALGTSRAQARAKVRAAAMDGWRAGGMIWMELRCDNRGEADWDIPRSESTRCWSADDSGPSDSAQNNARSVAATFKELLSEAKTGGWRRTRQGWICPGCAALKQGDTNA